MTFAKYLVTEIGVAAVPGSSFYRNPADGRTHLRFTFCKKESTFQAAAERLAKLKKSLTAIQDNLILAFAGKVPALRKDLRNAAC